jgi:hypothetical protein
MFLSGIGDRGNHSADFHVVSDTQLDVEIPEALSGNVRLVVVNSKGATLVATQNDLTSHPGQPHRPIDSRRASHVPRIRSTVNPVAVVATKGTVKDPGLRDTYFIENGGRVMHMGDNGVYFVKNGGRIEGPPGRALVFHEPRAEVSVGGGSENAEGDREFETVSLSVVPTGFVIVPP